MVHICGLSSVCYKSNKNYILSNFCTVGCVTLVCWAADNIFIHFQTVLSQKHIITCHNIYSPALVKYGQYRVFFSISLKDEKQQKNGGSITQRQRQYQKPPLCKLHSLPRSKQTHSTCSRLPLHIRWGPGRRSQGRVNPPQCLEAGLLTWAEARCGRAPGQADSALQPEGGNLPGDPIVREVLAKPQQSPSDAWRTQRVMVFILLQSHLLKIKDIIQDL